MKLCIRRNWFMFFTVSIQFSILFSAINIALGIDTTPQNIKHSVTNKKLITNQLLLVAKHFLQFLSHEIPLRGNELK